MRFMLHEQKNKEATVSDDDLALLDSYRAGQPEALTALVERYRKPLFAFILKMTTAYQEADDVFQEVWLRAIRRLDRFDNRNLLGWLFRIAHNLLVDKTRRKKIMTSLDGLDAENEDGIPLQARLPDAAPTPAEAVEAGDQATRVRQALQLLAPEQKEVFLMRVEADLSFKEIAVIQGVSINTALGRMHYAVTRLRRALSEEMPDANKT